MIKFLVSFTFIFSIWSSLLDLPLLEIIEPRPGPVNVIVPNINLVRTYVKYAALAVCSDKVLYDWTCPLCSQIPGKNEFIGSFDDLLTGTHGYININHDSQVIILGFRNTDNAQNILLDLTMIPLPLGIENVQVHKGFHLATIAILNQMLVPLAEQFRKYPDYKMVLTGHSLGGSMASISTVLLINIFNLNPSKIELYTYGMPRTGNTVFANYINSLSIIVARVTKSHDIIPHTIPRALFTHHHNELFLYNNNPDPIICSTETFEDVRCSYRDSLLRLAPSPHFEYLGVSFEKHSCE